MQQSPEQLDGPTPRDRLVGRLSVVAAALMWSSCGLFARAPIFDDWPMWQRGLMFSFWRAFFAALVLLPTVRRPRFRGLLVPLGICFTLMNVSYLSAIVLTTPANAICLQAAAPWWVFLFSVAYMFARKERAAASPWGAGATTLEWTLPSPPPFHTFETLPRVK